MANDFWGAQLRAREIEEETGLSLAEQASMPLDEWARLTHGMTPAQAALSAVNAQHEEPPAAPDSAFTQTVEEPQGIDPDSDDFFLAWRKNRVSGGEGKGIFDSVGSQSPEYRAAAARHAGRTGYGQEVHAVVPRAFVRHDDQLDQRPAHVRLSNAANLWQGR
jgi:hypothetical protein